MTTQFIVAEEYGRNSAKKFVIHETELLNQEARFACALVERWGLVAAMPDGEDSAGRAKMRLPTPQELSSRSCEMAAAIFAEFRSRGWTVEGPDVSALLRKTDD